MKTKWILTRRGRDYARPGERLPDQPRNRQEQRQLFRGETGTTVQQPSDRVGPAIDLAIADLKLIRINATTRPSGDLKSPTTETVVVARNAQDTRIQIAYVPIDAKNTRVVVSTGAFGDSDLRDKVWDAVRIRLGVLNVNSGTSAMNGSTTQPTGARASAGTRRASIDRRSIAPSHISAAAAGFLPAAATFCVNVFSAGPVTSIACAMDIFLLLLPLWIPESAPRELPATRPLEIEPRLPAKVTRVDEGHYFLDFGKDAFGFLQLDIDSPDARELDIRLGEKLKDNAIDPKPGGSIRFAATKLAITPGKHTYRVQTPPDKRNTSGAAARLPESIGVVLPFRYVEIANCPAALDSARMRQMVVHYPFDDAASSFTCSDPGAQPHLGPLQIQHQGHHLRRRLCRRRSRAHPVRSRRVHQPARALLRRSRLLARALHPRVSAAHPTWPAEWKQHSVLIAYADWMYSGDLDSLRRNYDLLKREKSCRSTHARMAWSIHPRSSRWSIGRPANAMGTR